AVVLRTASSRVSTRRMRPSSLRVMGYPPMDRIVQTDTPAPGGRGPYCIDRYAKNVGTLRAMYPNFERAYAVDGYAARPNPCRLVTRQRSQPGMKRTAAPLTMHPAENPGEEYAQSRPGAGKNASHLHGMRPANRRRDPSVRE